MSNTPVVAVFFAKPGAEAKVEELFRSVIDTTVKEEGCIFYHLTRDTENPRCFIFMEAWASKALLEKHLSAPHITKLFAALPDYIESSRVSVLERLA